MMKIEADTATLTTRLNAMEQGLRDLRPIWGEVQQVFIGFMKRVFKTEGEYSGDRWVPLNPEYAKRKKSEVGNRGILQYKLGLVHSLTDPDHADHVMRTGPTFAEFGTRTIYAKAQQYGRPEIKLPARPFIRDITKAEGEQIADIILAHVLKRATRVVRR